MKLKKNEINSLFLIVLVMVALGAMLLFAPSARADDAECAGLKFGTGPEKKGYSNTFANVKKVCGAKVELCEVNTDGGLSNLNALSTNDEDVGLASIDAYTSSKNGDSNIAELQAILPMNYNYLHTVVSSSGYTYTGKAKLGGWIKGDSQVTQISLFSQLRNLPVAVTGSAQLLVRKLNQALGLNMVIVDVDGNNADNRALAMVKSNQVAAALSLSGWPSGVTKNLTQGDGLTLAKFDVTISEPYQVKTMNYPKMGVYNVNALAVQNILFTRPFKGEKAVLVSKLKECIVSNLSNFKEGSFEPSWKEIKDLDNTYGVPKFSSASATVISTKRK